MRDNLNSTNDVVLDRRTFLKVVGAGSCALALSSTGCTIAEVFADGDGVIAFDLTDPVFSGLADVNGTAVVDAAGRKLIPDSNRCFDSRGTQPHLHAPGCRHGPDEIGELGWRTPALSTSRQLLLKQRRGTLWPATTALASYPVSFDSAAGTGTVTIGASGDEPVDPNPIPEEYRDLVNPFADDDADALAAGEVVWAQCSGCHGAQGQGNEAINATAFNGDNSAYADDYLFWRLRTGGATGPAGSIMPAYSKNSSAIPGSGRSLLI